MNKMFLFSITKEFLMQGITHLYKTSPHSLKSYMNCRNFYEVATYSLDFVLLVASCVRTNCNGEALHQRPTDFAQFFSLLALRLTTFQIFLLTIPVIIPFSTLASVFCKVLSVIKRLFGTNI